MNTSNIVNFDTLKDYVLNSNVKFGYISIANFIRNTEMMDIERHEKDILLSFALRKMDYGKYETFFSESMNLHDLYQKIFLLIMIEYVSDYLNIKNFIVWNVIARYYVEEHIRLSPHDFNLQTCSSSTPKGKIYAFFVKKNIDIQSKLYLYTDAPPTLFEMIVDYFHKRQETE